MSTAPIYDIDPKAFWADPYPDLAAMRRKTPIAFVPQLGATLLTRRAHIFEYEKRVDLLSSVQPGGLMTVLMGENMMRKDGDAHQAERRQMFPAVSPRTVRDHWADRFRVDTRRTLDALTPCGEAEICRDAAMPISADALRALTGLETMTQDELDSTSQAMIDGCANYLGDSKIEARCHWGTRLIDAHITRQMANPPAHSILAVLLAAGQPESQIRANIKLAISGGQNEPRDAIAGAAWALITHPEERAKLERGTVGWDQVFAEYVRWMSPIGMSPRRVAKAFSLDGVTFAPEDRVFLMFSSANRDEDVFDMPERFDLDRDASDHIAFGAGPHFCAGAWASKALVAEIALPMLFERLGNLRLARPARFGGWAFRGPLEVPVIWDI